MDLQINPGEICGEQGLIRLVALMKSFLELGGLMLTMTGVDRETMEKAQREPEKYQNLRVRLGDCPLISLHFRKRCRIA